MADVTNTSPALERPALTPSQLDAVEKRASYFGSIEYHYSKFVDRMNRMHDTEDDDIVDAMTESAWAYAERMLNKPSKSIDHIRWKAEVLWGDGGLPNSEDVVRFLADLAQLSGGNVSPLFNADRWIDRFSELGGAWVVNDGKVHLLTPDNNSLAGVMAQLDIYAGRPAVEARLLERHASKELSVEND